MASELAERRGIALIEARALLAAVDLTAPVPVAQATRRGTASEADSDIPSRRRIEDGHEPPRARTTRRSSERAMSYAELAAVESMSAPQAPQSDADVRAVLENGIRDISGEVRNSLDFHRSQEGGGEVSHVVLSGAALDIPGFAEALQSSLGVEVRAGEVGVAGDGVAEISSPHRLAVAAGLAAAEAPQ